MQFRNRCTLDLNTKIDIFTLILIPERSLKNSSLEVRQRRWYSRNIVVWPGILPRTPIGHPVACVPGKPARLLVYFVIQSIQTAVFPQQLLHLLGDGSIVIGVFNSLHKLLA